MQKCTFKAVNHDGSMIRQIQIRTNSYEQAVLEACEWFRGLDDKEGLHLITTAKFKNKNLPEDAFERVCKALNDACPGAYEEVVGNANEKTMPLLNEGTLLVIVGSMIPPDVSFPYTKGNHKIYLWIDWRKGDSNLMNLVEEGDYDSLYRELENLHIAFIDLAGRCFRVENSREDADILCFCADQEAINRLAYLNLGGDRVVSVSLAVKRMMDELGIENEYHTLVGNASHADWYPIIDELLRANGIEPNPADR